MQSQTAAGIASLLFGVDVLETRDTVPRPPAQSSLTAETLSLDKIYSNHVHPISFPEGEIDIDTPQDYVRAQLALAEPHFQNR